MRQEGEYLNSKQLDYFKKTLEEKKANLLFTKEDLGDLNFDEEDRSDEVDQANADSMNAERLRFRNRENFFVKKINEALMRIENEEYGHCQDCGGPIGVSRLSARPTAELCISCKEEAERGEMMSIYKRKSSRPTKQ